MNTQYQSQSSLARQFLLVRAKASTTTAGTPIAIFIMQDMRFQRMWELAGGKRTAEDGHICYLTTKTETPLA